jgi:hypothetical protein
MIKKILSILVLVILSISLFGCYEYTTPTIPSQVAEQQHVENNQQTLKQNQPIPTITKSLERENLINRIKLLNDENKVFYIYLLSNDGKVMAFYTAKGKVSSLNSYLNSQLRIVADTNCLQQGYEGSRTSCYNVIDTPDIDGSYGKNVDGIFFFTTENVYVEWNGLYMSSDQPLQLTTKPILIREVN